MTKDRKRLYNRPVDIRVCNVEPTEDGSLILYIPYRDLPPAIRHIFYTRVGDMTCVYWYANVLYPGDLRLNPDNKAVVWHNMAHNRAGIIYDLVVAEGTPGYELMLAAALSRNMEEV